MDDYFFGMFVVMISSDLWMIGVLGVVVVFMMLFFWFRFKVFMFDLEYVVGLGLFV